MEILGRTKRFFPGRGWFHLSALFALPFFWISGAIATDQTFVTIGTGGVTGVYYPAGSATCRIVNQQRAEHGIRCAAESTLGSISNLNKIRSGEFEFGFAQSDWKNHAFQGTSSFHSSEPFKELREVFSLHSEIATIVVRADADIQSVPGLKGQRLNVGSPGSGSAESWKAISQALEREGGNQSQLVDLKQSELPDALCSAKIDAFFVLIGHPARLIKETQENCPIRLIGVAEDALEALTGNGQVFSAAVIPAGLYGNAEPVQSVGVLASLVTTARMPDEIVYALVRSVHENLEGFTQLHPALSNLKAQDLVKQDKDVPLHPGALKYYQEQGLLASD